MSRKQQDRTGTQRKQASPWIHLEGIWCVLGFLIVVSSLFLSVFFPPAMGDVVPYPVLGVVSSCDGSLSFPNAQVTVQNPRTGVTKSDSVSVEGLFLVTFGNLMGPDEWYHGDPLLVWVNGTGDYGDYRGSLVTQFDKHQVPPHRVNITLCSPSIRIPSPPENLQATLGFTDSLYWIELTWDPSPGMDSTSPVTYHIYRGTTPQDKGYRGSAMGSLSFNDTHLPFNTTYHYCVTAENIKGESPPSPLVTITTRLSPIAHFSIYPLDLKPHETIYFTDSSRDPDGVITNWTWHVTPGDILYGEHATYTFPAPGSYTVTLTVTDNTGDQDATTRTLLLSMPQDDTPGFELLVLLLSLTGAIVIYTQKIHR